MRRFFAAVFVYAVLCAPALAQGEAWEIDSAHSGAHFTVRHMMVSNVRGEFTKVAGKVVVDPQDITQSSVDATIDATTIFTRETRRDEHLKGPDFFDVAKFPTITFRSKSVQKAEGGKAKVIGDLTIKDVTKEVVLDVEPLSPAVKDARGNLKSGTSATTKINRKDFGILWDRTLDGGGVVVGSEVAITIEVELNRKAPAPAAKSN